MEILRWVAVLQHRRRTMILVALVTTFAGVGLLIDRPKGTIVEWLALPLLVVGGGLLTLAGSPSTDAAADISTTRWIRFFPFLPQKGAPVPLFSAIGGGPILSNVFYCCVSSSPPSPP